MYIEDNFVRVGKYKPCPGCNGNGFWMAPLGYCNDRVEEKCEYCNGSGYRLIEMKVECRVDQPFPLAKD